MTQIIIPITFRVSLLVYRALPRSTPTYVAPVGLRPPCATPHNGTKHQQPAEDLLIAGETLFRQSRPPLFRDRAQGLRRDTIWPGLGGKRTPGDQVTDRLLVTLRAVQAHSQLGLRDASNLGA
jgi:hypothetical protein